MDVHNGLKRVLWIGGAQWAGKSSVAQLLVMRHPLLLYAYDYHDARAHADRARAEPGRFPHRHALLTALDRDPDAVWVTPTPEAMAEAARHGFRERFVLVIEDLLALPSGVPVLAEGWGLRPDLLAPVLADPRQAVFLVPSEEFRRQQVQRLTRAGRLDVARIRDADRAQHNRLERDRILAEDVAVQARQRGLRVIMVDGRQSIVEVAAQVEEQFRPFLPPWRY